MDDTEISPGQQPPFRVPVGHVSQRVNVTEGNEELPHFTLMLVVVGMAAIRGESTNRDSTEADNARDAVCGRYVDTVRRTGLICGFPWNIRRNASVRMNNFETNALHY